jgi:hypothetical protein
MAPPRTLLSAIIVRPARKIGDTAPVTWVRRLGHWIGLLGIMVVAVISAAWAFGAVWFDAPFGNGNKIVAALVGTAFVVALVFVRPLWRKLGVFVVVFAGVLTWWLTITPSGDRPWQPDVAQKAWADIQGDEVTVHNVRNFDYRSETDYTPHWETRTVQLSKLTGADLAINYWGSPWIAHPIASFQFSDSLPLAFSIETRKVVGQSYSTLAGFYRQYELIYIPADERDVIRLRTNYRNEDVYLYHTRISPGHARGIFLEYLQHLNQLHAKAEFYNAVTDNCTTNIRAANIAAEHGKVPPWNWRVLLNGKMDELLYARGFIDTSLPLTDLKARSHINARAKAAGNSPDFCQLIRVGLPNAMRP